ncbi:MAG: nucleotidyltransferase family protein [Armatimonadetes bacterium]|nr:nucleotidyltransferase family protein [Armatimonadota bacterium]
MMDGTPGKTPYGLVAIILAAGESRRMGRPKQLLPYGDRTVLQRVADNVLASGVRPVIVVLGHRAEEVRASLGDRPVVPVVNTDYASGMLSSVQAGVRAALPLLMIEGRRGFLFCLGDQPQVGPEVIRAVATAFADTERGIVVPVLAGRRGHPAAYSAVYAGEILALGPGVGLREVLRRHPEDVCAVPLEEEGILADLDTPEEYRRAVSALPTDPTS